MHGSNWAANDGWDFFLKIPRKLLWVSLSSNTFETEHEASDRSWLTGPSNATTTTECNKHTCGSCGAIKNSVDNTASPATRSIVMLIAVLMSWHMELISQDLINTPISRWLRWTASIRVHGGHVFELQTDLVLRKWCLCFHLFPYAKTIRLTCFLDMLSDFSKRNKKTHA